MQHLLWACYRGIYCARAAPESRSSATAPAQILARQDALPRRTLNCGGPLRLSRVDMAHAVAAVRGYDPALVLPGSAGAVARTCATPADISMKCSALEEALQLRLMPFQDALRETFGLA